MSSPLHSTNAGLFFSQKKPNAMLKDNKTGKVYRPPFKTYFTEKDYENIKKIDAWIALRIHKTEDIMELQRLDLLDDVLYALKTAYYTEAWMNRQIVIQQQVENNRIIEDLTEKLREQVEYTEIVNQSYDVLVQHIYRLQYEKLSLQEQIKDPTNHEPCQREIISLTRTTDTPTQDTVRGKG